MARAAKGRRDFKDRGDEPREWRDPKEQRGVADPNSPFAKLAALKEQLERARNDSISSGRARPGSDVHAKKKLDARNKCGHVRSRRLTDRQRIDKWLWHARVVRTRTAAAALVNAGNVRLNGARVGAASQLCGPVML